MLKIEVAVLKALQKSQHVCSYYNCGRNEQLSYIVMSYAGKSVAQLQHAQPRGKSDNDTNFVT